MLSYAKGNIGYIDASYTRRGDSTMAFIFSRYRPNIAYRMAAKNKEMLKQLQQTKFAKTSNGFWLAWNPAEPETAALLMPDQPEGEYCDWFYLAQDNPTFESFIEYVESGEFERDQTEDSNFRLNLFIEEVFCPGTLVGTGQTCQKTVFHCKSCGKDGCAHGHKGICSHQGFAGIECVHCGAIGKIGELRDGRPAPSINLDAFDVNNSAMKIKPLNCDLPKNARSHKKKSLRWAAVVRFWMNWKRLIAKRTNGPQGAVTLR